MARGVIAPGYAGLVVAATALQAASWDAHERTGARASIPRGVCLGL